MNAIDELKQLTNAYSLKIKDCGNGHIQLENHGTLVNYWPNSKKRTAYVKGGESVSHCSPWDAVKLCLQNSKDGLGIKKRDIPKNRPQMELAPISNNPAGVRNFYIGKRPPWEYPEMIICHSDQLRIDALHLRDQADQMDYINET